jgi:hypothetical protein
VSDIHELAEQIKALTPPERLRMAADLMERKRGDIAYVIAKTVVDELGAALALRNIARRG